MAKFGRKSMEPMWEVLSPKKDHGSTVKGVSQSARLESKWKACFADATEHNEEGNEGNLRWTTYGWEFDKRK